MTKKRKPMSEEKKQEARERMQKYWAEKRAQTPEPRESTIKFPTAPLTAVPVYAPAEVILDLTRINLISEADLIEHIRKEFDERELPTVIKVTSRQAMNIIDASSRVQEWGWYPSPFGEHQIIIIPEKELL